MPHANAVKPYARKVRVATMVQHCLSQYLATKILDPRLQGLAILEVDVSPDLRQAKVLLLQHGGRLSKAAKQALHKARHHLRHHLASQLALRVVPDLTFKGTAPNDAEQRLVQLLDQVCDTPSNDEEL